MTPATQQYLDHCKTTYAVIRDHYLSLPGKSIEGWEQNVASNPQRFNQVWNHLLHLPPSNNPPPLTYRTIDFSTGEIAA